MKETILIRNFQIIFSQPETQDITIEGFIDIKHNCMFDSIQSIHEDKASDVKIRIQDEIYTKNCEYNDDILCIENSNGGV